MKNSQRSNIEFAITLITGGIAIGGIAFALLFKSDDSFLSKSPAIRAAIGVIIFASLIILTLLIIFREKIHLYQLKRKKLSRYIIEKLEVKIDIFSRDGKKASLFHHTEFFKVGNSKYKTYESKLAVSGQIQMISQYNCSMQWVEKPSSLLLPYSDGKDKPSYYQDIVKEQNKFLMYTALIVNTFNDTVNEWTFKPEYYCRNYTLEILLPPGSKYSSAKIYRINGEGKKVQHHYQPIRSVENGRTKLYVRLTDLDVAPDTIDGRNLTESFTLSWVMKLASGSTPAR